MAKPPPAVPPPRPLPAKRSTWKLGLGIPLLAVGLGGVGLGAASLALDGNCANEPACGKVYDTRLPGGIEVGFGGALLVTGMVLIAVDRAERRRKVSHDL